LHSPGSVDLAKVRQFHRTATALLAYNAGRHGDAQMVETVNEIVMVPVEEIRPFAGNPRVNDATVDKLCELIPKVGFNVPLVVSRRDGMLVKGHARLKAAIRLSMPEVPVVYSDADSETCRLDRISDNRVGEFSTWDEVLLPAELAMLAPGDMQFVESLDLLIPAPFKPPAPPQREGEFITREDELATASMPVVEYGEAECPKCGHVTYYRVR
jgi:hypothetical protein